MSICMHWLKALFFCCILALSAAPLTDTFAAESVAIESAFAMCISPTDVEANVSTEEQKKNFPACQRWSSFFRTTGLSKAEDFQKSGCNARWTPPAKLFALAVINNFRQEIRLPALVLDSKASRVPLTSKNLYENPKTFGLREVQKDESKAGSLIVWNGAPEGMVGLVRSDGNDPDAVIDLAKIRIAYPGTDEDAAGCASLKQNTADVIAVSLKNTTERFRRNPHFLKIAPLTPFWNYWIETDDNPGVEQPAAVDPKDKWYRFRISLSSLEFPVLKARGRAGVVPMTSQQAKAVMPSFADKKYTLLILPIGPIRFEDDVQTLRLPFTVDTQRLRDSLVNPQVDNAPSLNSLAGAHDALKRSDTAGSVSVRFALKEEAECAVFAVIVSDAASGEIVSGWTRPMRVTGTLAAKDDDACGDTHKTTRRMDLVALFDQVVDGDVSARLSFLEFSGTLDISKRTTIGNFVVQGNEPDTMTWVLNARSLQNELGQIGREIDKVVADTTFSVMPKAKAISDLLFECRHDNQCAGTDARDRLKSIAANPPKNARISVSFRDSGNSIFYVPAQLIPADDTTLIGQRLTIVQPFPRPSGKLPADGACVKTWSGGILVSDDQDDILGSVWRKGWTSSWSAPPHNYVNKQLVDDMDELRNYLKADENLGSPEGLMIAAHHGTDGITDYSDDNALRKWIHGRDLRRSFDKHSFGVLALCSVGALSESNIANSTIIDMLNANHLRAAIVSPFNLPLQLAKSLLNHMQRAVLELEEDTSLYEVFRRAKESLLTHPEDGERYLGIQSAVQTLMLLGDGSVKICKR